MNEAQFGLGLSELREMVSMIVVGSPFHQYVVWAIGVAESEPETYIDEATPRYSSLDPDQQLTEEKLGVWLRALQSGHYREQRERLVDNFDAPTRHCCLGVYQAELGAPDAISTYSYPEWGELDADFSSGLIEMPIVGSIKERKAQLPIRLQDNPPYETGFDYAAVIADLQGAPEWYINA